jgi:hypothetical protein
MDNRVDIIVVGSAILTLYTYIDLDFLGDKHTNVIVVIMKPLEIC